jgi:hypothetical protein
MSPLPTLVEVLAELPDPRDPRGRIHPLVSVLSLAIVATLSGCRSLAAISQFGRDRGAAFAHALGFRRGKTPAPSTLSELFRDLDAEALDRLIGRWLASRHAAGWDVVTLDGKTVRGSRDGDDAPAVHLLAAYAPQAAAVIGQLRVDAKTNEHKAALRLLGVLPPLGGAVVTADTMFTHRDVAEKVRENQGHYLLPVKDNQATLLADLTATFAAPATFSPLPTPQLGRRRPDGDDPRQGPRPDRTPHPDQHHLAQRLPRLARRRPGVPPRTGTPHQRERHRRGRLRDHQPAPVTRRRRPTPHPHPGPLGHREPPPLHPG